MVLDKRVVEWISFDGFGGLLLEFWLLVSADYAISL